MTFIVLLALRLSFGEWGSMGILTKGSFDFSLTVHFRDYFIAFIFVDATLMGRFSVSCLEI